MRTYLSLHQFSLAVSLGCGEAERAHLQQVLIDITLQFEKLPQACSSDTLTDTICYATLVKNIYEFCENKSFKLLEHLTYQIYGFIRSQLAGLPVTIKITKFPPTADLDRCTFTISDH